MAKGLAALATLVGLLPGVHTPVFPEQGTVGEGFTALATHVEPLAHVGPAVQSE